MPNKKVTTVVDYEYDQLGRVLKQTTTVTEEDDTSEDNAKRPGVPYPSYPWYGGAFQPAAKGALVWNGTHPPAGPFRTYL